jgi:hypothetical protein
MIRNHILELFGGLSCLKEMKILLGTENNWEAGQVAGRNEKR